MMKIFQKKKSFNFPGERNNIRGHFDGYNGKSLWGWACYDEKLPNAELVLSINGQEYKRFFANKFRQDLKDAGIHDGCVAFHEVLDIQDILQKYGSDAVLKVSEVFTGKELSNSPKVLVKPDVKWGIDVFSDEFFAGWIVDLNNEDLRVKINVYVDDILVDIVEAGLLRQDLSVLGLANCYHGFHVDFSRYVMECSIYKVRFEVEYDGKYILSENKLIFPFYYKIKQLTDLQSYLRANGYHKTDEEKNLLVKSILPGLIDECRIKNEVPLADLSGLGTVELKNEIAVIVPIYKGVEETINCLKSVISSKNEQSYRLIAINDYSPDEEMQANLEMLAEQSNFELLNNSKNLGFVGTVNRGMKLAQGYDVILLNSDTIVPDGWLDAIVSVASSSAVIGTVTPMSNNATICSYPSFCLDNELPNGYDVHLLAKLCAENNEPEVELPTAHGYCMFIKRAVINEVGYFDEQKWGKGYAEENDFSLRASKLGWKHVVTNKTFIHHLGSVSFAEDTESFIATNLEKLNGMYPDYPKLVQEFIRKDPVRSLRKEIGKKLLKQEIAFCEPQPLSKGKSILYISLTIGGGTKVATDDLAGLLHKEGQSVFMLTTKDDRIWTLSSHVNNAKAEFDIVTEYEEFIWFLKELDVWHIHYHHVLEFGKNIWNIPSDLDCAYDVTLHDYFSICPRVNFITSDNRFCGEPDVDGCRDCLRSVGVHEASFLKLKDLGGDIVTWRNFFFEKLSNARKVITPSRDAKVRFERYLPLNNIEALYHPEQIETIHVESQPRERNDVVNIGFIGAIGPHKGLQVIKDFVEEIAITDRSFEITIIGYTSDDSFFEKYDFVKITGAYKHDQLERIISDSAVDVIFLASIWPETYSYTYSEVVRLGCPVVSFNHGAVVERSIDNVNSLIVETSLSSCEILNNIEAFLGEQLQDCNLVVGADYDCNIIKNYYGFN